jgi:hypothetical protein
MWTKIILCCFVWLSVVGNTVWAEATQDKTGDVQKNAKGKTETPKIEEKTSEDKTKEPATEESNVFDRAGAYINEQVKELKDDINAFKSSIETAEKKRQDAKKAEQQQDKIQDARTNGPFGKCSTFSFDFACNISNWVYYWINQILTAVGQWMLEVVFIQSNLSTNKTVIEFQANFSSLAWTFLLVFLTYQLVRILSLMILQEDYSELKPLIRKVVIVAALIPSSLWICQKLFMLGNMFSLFYIKEDLGKIPQKLYGLNILSAKVNIGLLLILLIILLILLFIIAFQMIIRQAEFAFLVIIGPIAVVTMLNREMNFFSIWWRYLLAVVFAQSLQVLMIVLAFRLMTEPGLALLTTCLGLLLLTMRVPKMANEWFRASSVFGAAGGMVKSAANFTASVATGGTTTIARQAALALHSANKKK